MECEWGTHLAGEKDADRGGPPIVELVPVGKRPMAVIESCYQYKFGYIQHLAC